MSDCGNCGSCDWSHDSRHWCLSSISDMCGSHGNGEWPCVGMVRTWEKTRYRHSTHCASPPCDPFPFHLTHTPTLPLSLPSPPPTLSPSLPPSLPHLPPPPYHGAQDTLIQSSRNTHSPPLCPTHSPHAPFALPPSPNHSLYRTIHACVRIRSSDALS